MIQNPSWLNENSTRTYPFKEGCTLRTGEYTIPTNFLVDVILSGCDPVCRYRVNYIERSNTTISLGVADSEGQFHGVVNVEVSEPRYTTQYFQPTEGSTLSGRFVFGEGLKEITNIENNKRYYFGFPSTEIEPAQCVPLPNQFNYVTSLSRFEDGVTGPRLTGDVKLIEGDNISITALPAMNAFRFDAWKEYNCECAEDLEKYTRCKNCIKTINSMRPNDAGNIDIIGGQFIQVTSTMGINGPVIKISFAGEVDCCCTACDEMKDLRNRVEGALSTFYGQ